MHLLQVINHFSRNYFYFFKIVCRVSLWIDGHNRRALGTHGWGRRLWFKYNGTFVQKKFKLGHFTYQKMGVFYALVGCIEKRRFRGRIRNFFLNSDCATPYLGHTIREIAWCNFFISLKHRKKLKDKSNSVTKLIIQESFDSPSKPLLLYDSIYGLKWTRSEDFWF